MASRQNSPTSQRWFDYVAQTLHVSPLYSALFEHIKNDPDILQLFTLIERNQPPHITVFSAVNEVLFKHSDHELAQFYPYLTDGHPRPPQEAYPAFRAFCLEYMESLQMTLAGARLQTNEVTRCANLLPAFAQVFRHEPERSFELIELGCSAGLNLNLFRYGYHYSFEQNDLSCGNLASRVQIVCHVSEYESFPLPLESDIARVVSCRGIDLSPLDVRSDGDVIKLRSCIWPEEKERYHLLDAVIDTARAFPPMIHQGDALEVLPALIRTLPEQDKSALITWHSFALAQGPVEVRQGIECILAETSKSRPVYDISIEADATSTTYTDPTLELTLYTDGIVTSRETLATCAIHGETMTWRGSHIGKGMHR